MIVGSILGKTYTRMVVVVLLVSLIGGFGVSVVGATGRGVLEFKMKSRIMIPAPSLRNGLLENADKQGIWVLLPSSYNVSAKKYPVIYFLQGYTWSVDQMEPMFSGVDPNNTIVVLVPGYNILGGSFYENSPVTGNWEDFVVSDVINYVDDHYRTLRDPAFRGLSGLSMGGTGALNIAMKHPDVFGSTFAISPALFDRNGLSNSEFSLRSVIDRYLSIQRELSTLNRTAAHSRYMVLIRDISYEESVSLSSSSDLMFTLAYGSAFSPNPTKVAPYIDYLYYVDSSGNVARNETVWGNWEGGWGDVDGKVDRYKGNLQTLKGIGFECASNDEHRWVPQGCEYFSQKLDSEKINHVFIKTNYTHAESLQLRIEEELWPFFMTVFGRSHPSETASATTIATATIASPSQTTSLPTGWVYLALGVVVVAIDVVLLIRRARRPSK